MRIHHSYKHGESLSGFTITCESCGDEFHAAQQDRKHCSRSCVIEERDYTGENHPNWSGGLATRVCETCGDEYQKKAYKAEDSRFCSKSCLSDWASEAFRGSKSALWSGGSVEVQCEFCGDPVLKTKHQAEKSDNSFCDRRCLGKWLSENRVGEDHHQWKESTPDGRGQNWEEQRNACIERDFSRCRVCSIPRDKHKKKHNRDFSVHHRTPFAYFDSYKKANRLRNLITLCKPCHYRIERDWNF